MSLNIKNEEVHQLVRHLAEITGESQTEAIKHAVEERLHRLEPGKTRLEKLMEISRDCAERLRAKGAINDNGEFLYGPDGLPS